MLSLKGKVMEKSISHIQTWQPAAHQSLPQSWHWESNLRFWIIGASRQWTEVSDFVDVFARCASQKTHGHARIARFAQRAKKCDTNHKPWATASGQAKAHHVAPSPHEVKLPAVDWLGICSNSSHKWFVWQTNHGHSIQKHQV